MELLVPHYELRGNYITPIAGKPVKRQPLDGAFWPKVGERPRRGGFSPAVVDFGNIPYDAPPKDILSFANRYGALAADIWNPWDGLGRRGAGPEELAQVRRELEAVNRLRVLRVYGEDRTPAADEPRSPREALIYQPSELTWSLWLREHVDAWRAASLDFWGLCSLICSIGIVLADRHGERPLRAWAGPQARQALQTIQVVRAGLAAGRASPGVEARLHAEWGREYPVPDRLIDAVRLVEVVSQGCFLASAGVVRPRTNGVGLVPEPRPLSILNLLYLSLFRTYMYQPPVKCRLPECQAFARPDSDFCTAQHGNTYQQRRYAAKFSFEKLKGRGPTPAEAEKMESLLRSGNLAAREIAEKAALSTANQRPRSRRSSAAKPRRSKG